MVDDGYRSGDGHVYALNHQAEVQWKFEANNGKGQPGQHDGTSCYGEEPQGGDSTWFEGNVVVNTQGTIIAGNDDFRTYGLYPNGTLKFALYELLYLTTSSFFVINALLSPLP